MTSRPRVIVNVAMSLNGMIAGKSGERVNISSAYDWERVYKLRSSVDAIVVGANTVIRDNPKLSINNVEHDPHKLPTRVVLDANLRVPRNANVFDGSMRTMVFTEKSDEIQNAEMMRRRRNELLVDNLLTEFGSIGFKKILVEGGKRVISEFVSSGNVDEFYLYVGDVLIEKDGLRLFDLDANITNVISDIQMMKSGILISLNPYLLRESWIKRVKDF
ncbi:MAG: dihydrofolate reductase family protein [Thermoplasmatales archaeon]|nr:dihydrofolate reductase family protein [Thermoplasmatales archaeon]MCW6170194.1 dihydrofolate reductase family protein [Thermoplasmatales archaeon]